jgi:excisionase family DNA binding protein
MDNNQLLTTTEVAATLRLSRGTIDKLVREGALKRVKIGKSARFPAHSLESYITSLQGGGK